MGMMLMTKSGVKILFTNKSQSESCSGRSIDTIEEPGGGSREGRKYLEENRRAIPKIPLHHGNEGDEGDASVEEAGEESDGTEDYVNESSSTTAVQRSVEYQQGE
jgi:hypothetical protein